MSSEQSDIGVDFMPIADSGSPTAQRVPIALVLIAAIFASLGFLYSFLITLSILGLALSLFNIRFRTKELLILLLPLVLGILYFAISRSGYNTFISFKYYFGFWIAYLFFILYRKDLSGRHLLFVFLVLTAIEVLALNQPWFAISWRQGVLEGDNPHFATQYFGFYQRPFGVAFNPTMSSVLGVVLAERSFAAPGTTARGRVAYLILGLLIPIVYMAATGLVVYIAALLATRRSAYAWISLPVLLVLLFVAMQGFLEEAYSKLTIDALRILIEYKVEDFGRYLLPTSDCQRWFGEVACAGTYPLAYDDIGWLPFIFDMGIVAVTLYFLIAIAHLNRFNALPLFLVFLGSWHYPVAFSAVGQFVVAGLLLNKID